MKTTIIRSTAVVLASLAFTPVVVGAGTVNSVPTQGTAAFTPGNTSTPPTSPVLSQTTPPAGGTTTGPVTTATTPAQPGAGVATGNVGQLTLDYAPNLDFGTHATTDPGPFNATAQPYSGGTVLAGPLFAQVSDWRGNDQGWTLSVTEEGQFMNNGTPLTGAVVSFSSEIATNTSTTNAPAAVVNNTSLSLNTPTLVFSSQATTDGSNQGAGTNVISFGSGYDDSSAGLAGNIGVDSKDTTPASPGTRITDSAVQLSAPSGFSSALTSSSYTTTFTWNLQDGPSSGPTDTANIL